MVKFREHSIKELKAKLENAAQMESLAKITVTKLNLSDSEALQVADLYPPWEQDVAYSLNFIVRYNNDLYRLKAVTNDPSCAPDDLKSGFEVISWIT